MQFFSISKLLNQTVKWWKVPCQFDRFFFFFFTKMIILILQIKKKILIFKPLDSIQLQKLIYWLTKTWHKTKINFLIFHFEKSHITYKIFTRLKFHHAYSLKCSWTPSQQKKLNVQKKLSWNISGCSCFLWKVQWRKN